MVISSRTPEGRPNHCPVCGSDLRIEPSLPAGDAPCPQCGHLLWFAGRDQGTLLVIKPAGNQLDSESLVSLIGPAAIQPGMRLVIDCTDVHHVSSAVLGKLIELKKRLRAVGGRLGLEHVPPDLLEVVRITRLEQVFDLEK